MARWCSRCCRWDCGESDGSFEYVMTVFVVTWAAILVALFGMAFLRAIAELSGYQL